MHSRSLFTRVTLASAGISCRRVSVCLSVRQSLSLSEVGVLLKRLNVYYRITQATPHPRTL